jgi:hypothetical protein
MQEKTERWLELCKQAAIEQDPEKLMALVKEINDLLETKERRLGIIPPKDSKLPHCRLVCEGDNSETFPLPPGVAVSPFLKLPSICIHKGNLLKAWVVICSYDDHVRLLSPSLLVGFATTTVYSGVGADVVMESITLIDQIHSISSGFE